MSKQSGDKGRPRIPSNLRIRRGTSYNAAVVGRDTLNDEEGLFNPENRRGSEGNLGGIESFRMSMTDRQKQQKKGGDSSPSSGHRHLGVIEQLAREDRIANASRNSTYAAKSNEQQSILFKLAGGSSNTNVPPLLPTNNTNTTLNPTAAPPLDSPYRPTLNTRVTANRLPAVAEVSSPLESAQSEETGLASAKGTRKKSDKQRSKEEKQPEYFPIGEADGSGSTSNPPKLISSLSVPAQNIKPMVDQPTISKDDVVVQDGGGKMERRPSNIAEPSPLTEEILTRSESQDQEHHDAEVADYLDVIDAEVGTLGYLTNVQNSIFVPNIPMLYDRRPVHDLSGSRKRSSTIASLAKRATGRRRSSVISSSVDRQSIRSDLEQQARAGSLMAGAQSATATGFAGGEKPSRAPTRTSILNRMTSAVGIKKKTYTEEEEAEFAKHIKEWRDMDEEERNELDEHVRLVLSKKSKFHRGLKGFWAFVKTPMGFIMTLYGFLITFWGTAIMLFIWHWIHVGERRRYWIEICDQILCALFAAVGLGFAPFRAVDTYRMIWIAKMHYRTWERRKALGLTDLQDKNDLPRPDEDNSNQVSRVFTGQEQEEQGPIRRQTFERSLSTVDSSVGPTPSSEQKNKHWWNLKHDDVTPSPGQTSQLLTPQSSHSEKSKGQKSKKKGRGHLVVPTREEKEDENENEEGNKASNRPVIKRNDSIKSELVKEREEIVVLTKEEQAILEHHQRKFHASHTFYRFHETSTHRAFPLDLMITIVCLLDCHSLFQGALGGCTWGIKYTHRPTALTASLITCSLSCNAVAGLLIYLGGRRTKKREEVERRLKIALEAMALAKIERRRARGELPERHAEGDSKASSTPTKDEVEGEVKEIENQDDEMELEEAVNLAARQTEDEDQAPYDETEEERNHHLSLFHHKRSGSNENGKEDSNLIDNAAKS